MDQKTCNSSIHCTVENCAYHAPQNCCSLKSINVGCCDSSPTSCKAPTAPFCRAWSMSGFMLTHFS